jgi:uncharacterized protein YjbJ (UPF0337 family)
MTAERHFTISTLQHEEASMNEHIIKAKWDEIVGKLQDHWSDLTEDEISKMQGNYAKLSDTISAKYGYEKEKVKSEIHDFLVKHKFVD